VSVNSHNTCEPRCFFSETVVDRESFLSCSRSLACSLNASFSNSKQLSIIYALHFLSHISHTYSPTPLLPYTPSVSSPCTNLPITSRAPESSTQLRIVMCQVQHTLRQIRCLHDTPNLDRALFGNQLPNAMQEGRRELQNISLPFQNFKSKPRRGKTNLRVPPILPSRQLDNRSEGIKIIPPLLLVFE
jgi:hypothetical protein